MVYNSLVSVHLGKCKMARDYAKRPNKKRGSPHKEVSLKKKKRKSSISPLTWIVTGLLMGLVIAAVAYLKLNIMPKDPVSATAAKPGTKTLAKAPPAPKFDFYTLLPEMEVKVAESTPPKAVTSPSQNTAEPVLPHPLEHVRYRLQLASFKRYSDADNLKAKLALSGHVVEIHPIKLDNGAVWYRVYTPTFPSREQALNLQKELQGQAINSMLLKDRES